MTRPALHKALLATGLALFGAASIHSLASAQTTPTPAAPAPAKHKNLQVLPADISREQLFATMKGFAQGLGVRCSHCHVGEEGQPLSTYDFASDAKREKRVARAMLRMTMAINRDTLPAIADLNDAHVTCFTCHRGAVKPLTAPPPPEPTPAAAS